MERKQRTSPRPRTARTKKEPVKREKKPVRSPAQSAGLDRRGAAAERESPGLQAGASSAEFTATTEKQCIYTRLVEFRKEWGLGGYAYLEELSGGELPAEILREMANGGKYPIQLWRLAGATLDKLEKPKRREQTGVRSSGK